MHNLIIIGAGPGGIALAAEAFASGIDPSQILILEKGPTHNSAIRQLYPEKKLTTANYKGFAARCEGLLCVRDMTKPDTLLRPKSDPVTDLYCILNQDCSCSIVVLCWT